MFGISAVYQKLRNRSVRLGSGFSLQRSDIIQIKFQPKVSGILRSILLCYKSATLR